jgi:putative transposase
MHALHERGMVPSTSRPANPYDNATCESFLKTLKREEINANTYRDFAQLEQGVREFIEHYYNRLRLHSALSYQPPEEFEKHMAQRRPETIRRGPMVTFLGT